MNRSLPISEMLYDASKAAVAIQQETPDKWSTYMAHLILQKRIMNA